MRDDEFCERWISMADNGYRVDDYLALFRVKESNLSGDVTPSYSALTEDEVESVRSALPGLNIILLVRDPVARAWSSFNMYLRRRKIPIAERGKPSELLALQEKATVAELSRFMNEPWCRQRSFPSVSYGRWASVFGKRRVHVTFFQDIVNRPVSVIEDVCKFLDVPLESPPVPAMNVKTKAARAAMTDEHEAFLNDFFKDEYVAMRALFPEGATEWDPQRLDVPLADERSGRRGGKDGI